jgi:hypothetical protein
VKGYPQTVHETNKAFALGSPCIDTGLWPYPSSFGSEETLARSSKVKSPTDWQRKVFSLKCETKCHQQRIRSMIMENGREIPHTLPYDPMFSAINFNSSTSDISIGVKVNGIWIGTYGQHGYK